MALASQNLLRYCGSICILKDELVASTMFLCVNAYQPIIFLQQTPIPFAMKSKGQSRVWSSLWTNLSLSKGLRMPSRQNSLKLSTEVIRRELATQALEESCYLAKKLVDVFVAVHAP